MAKQKIKTKFILAFGAFFVAGVLGVALAKTPPLPTDTLVPPNVIPESLPAPKILSPKNGTQVKSEKVTLQWTEVKGANRYTIELEFKKPRAADFSDSVFAIESDTTSYQYDLSDIKPKTRIRWTVYGVDVANGIVGTFSEPSEFVYKGKKALKKKKRALSVQTEPSTESLDAKVEVEKFLQDYPNLLAEYKKQAEEAAHITLPESYPADQHSFRYFDASWSSLLEYGQKIKKVYEEGDYERALHISGNAKRDYDEAISAIPSFAEGLLREKQEREQREEEERQNAEQEKSYEEEARMNREITASAKTAEQERFQSDHECVLQYLTFTLPNGYKVTSDPYFSPASMICRSLFIIPSSKKGEWRDDLQQTLFTSEPGIHILSNFSFGRSEAIFLQEKLEDKAKATPLNGDTWYYYSPELIRTLPSKGDPDPYTEYYEIVKNDAAFHVNFAPNDLTPKNPEYTKMKKDFSNLVKSLKIKTP